MPPGHRTRSTAATRTCSRTPQRHECMPSSRSTSPRPNAKPAHRRKRYTAINIGGRSDPNRPRRRHFLHTGGVGVKEIEKLITTYQTADSKCGRWKKGEAFPYIAVTLEEQSFVHSTERRALVELHATA